MTQVPRTKITYEDDELEVENKHILNPFENTLIEKEAKAIAEEKKKWIWKIKLTISL